MKVLAFDTETTGLPTERNPSIMDKHKWPHVVQLSYILFDTETKEVLILRNDFINIPSNVKITPESEKIHHISQEVCDTFGINIIDALNDFNNNLMKADLIVGHNIAFDKQLLMVECMRNKITQKFTVNGSRKKEYCTMKNGSEICKILKTSNAGQTYFKYPTLTELHVKLFETTPNGAHDALVDVLICLHCYLKIVDDYDFMIDSDTDSPMSDLKFLYEKNNVC